MQTTFRNVLNLAFFLLTLYGFTQGEFKVRGKINDGKNGEDLIGATIQIKNSANGTITDIEGNYLLSIPAGTHTLVYSYIGFLSIEREVTGNVGETITLDISLLEDQEVLEEVVIVGYGTSKKEDLAGSVSAINSEDFNKGIIVSPQQLLQGKVSGVRISSNSGEPGAGMSVSIRGINSMTGGGPLFVVDGIPLSGNASPSAEISGLGDRSAQNPLNFLNPADIKSIQVLKDASATAIYGSRATNGVVIIETNSGAQSGSSLEYSNYISISRIANQIDILTADEYREQQAILNPGGTRVLSQNSTDWQDVIFQTAFAQNHNISFKGGDEITKFGASIGVLRQEGIVKSNEYNRYNAKLDGSTRLLNDRWDLGLSVTYSHINNLGVPITNSGTGEDLLSQALRANPTVEFVSRLLPGGTYEYWQPEDGYNPQQLLDIYNDETRTDRVLASLNSNIELVDGLTFTTKIATDLSNGNRVLTLAPFSARGATDLFEEGLLSSSRRTNSSFLVDNYLTYSASWGRLSYKAMGGYSYQRFYRNNSTVEYRDLYDPNEIASEDNISSRYNYAYESRFYANVQSWNGGQNGFELSAAIARVNLNWEDKYLFESALRRDVSTKFNPENRVGFFPSGAFKWKASNEAFLSSLKSINELGLRVSWGQTGNEGIPGNSNELSFLSPVSSIDPRTGERIVTFNERFGNPLLIWETTTQINFGLDFSLFDSKIYGNVDYFTKRTEDLFYETSPYDDPELSDLYFSSFPNQTIIEQVWINSDASLETKGYEFLIGGYPINNSKLVWDLSVNLTAFNTIVKDLIDPEERTGLLGGDGLSGTRANIWLDGQELSFFLKEFVGFENSSTGFLDTEGNEITGVDAPQVAVGSVDPDFNFGINSVFYYGNWDFTMSWNGVKGLKLLNNTASANLSVYRFTLGQNTTMDYIEGGEPAGFISGLASSTYYLEDADFIRLNNLQIGYAFETNSISWLRKLRVYFTGQNLLLFTKYTGYDPEVNTNNSSDGFPSRGIDFSNYPKARTFSLGVNISL